LKYINNNNGYKFTSYSKNNNDLVVVKASEVVKEEILEKLFNFTLTAMNLYTNNAQIQLLAISILNYIVEEFNETILQSTSFDKHKCIQLVIHSMAHFVSCENNSKIPKYLIKECADIVRKLTDVPQLLLSSLHNENIMRDNNDNNSNLSATDYLVDEYFKYFSVQENFFQSLPENSIWQDFKFQFFNIMSQGFPRQSDFIESVLRTGWSANQLNCSASNNRDMLPNSVYLF
jgi:hypothetical protein